MGINMSAIKERAAALGIHHVQVPMRDFDRGSQAQMLPQAAIAIAVQLRLGRRVYVHCTAGINRAPLSIIGYLTFVEVCSLGLPLHKLQLACLPAAHHTECSRPRLQNAALLHVCSRTSGASMPAAGVFGCVRLHTQPDPV